MVPLFHVDWMHPTFLHDASRSGITHQMRRRQCIDIEQTECKSDDGTRRCGGVAAAPVWPTDPETQVLVLGRGGT